MELIPQPSKNSSSSIGFHLVFQAWVLAISGLVALSWGTSFLGQIGWMAVIGPAWLLLVASGTWFAGRNRWGACWQDIAPFVKFWPFLLLLALILAAAILYPPVSHDSISYRLPRILIWLQDGRISHVPVSDDRLNYMTHNWELVALPLFKLTGDAWLELPNIASWLVLYLIGISWARRFCPARPELHRWLVVLAVSAYLPVLQACRTNNDLFALVFVLLAVWFFWEARDTSKIRLLLFSGFSLALAAGTKPHYALLAPFWVLAFLLFFDWKSRIGRLVVVGVVSAPLALLVSPLPALLMNYLTYGTPGGPIGGTDMARGPFWERIVCGLSMSTWSNFAPPLNPIARVWNSHMASWLEQSGWAARQPRFGFTAAEVPIVDGAALGFFAAVAGLCGILLAFKHQRLLPREVWILALIGLAAYIISASQVMPGTMARSFIGFTYLGFPLVLAGLAFAPARPLRIWLSLGSLAAAVVVILTPSTPLWPVKSTLAWMKSNFPDSSALRVLETYSSFAERYESGAFVKDHIPPDATILAIMGGGEPLLQLWQPYSIPRRVEILAPGYTPQNHPDVDFIVIGGLAHQLHGPLVDQMLSAQTGYELLAEEKYISRLVDGRLPWRIFVSKRKSEIKMLESTQPGR